MDLSRTQMWRLGLLVFCHAAISNKTADSLDEVGVGRQCGLKSGGGSANAEERTGADSSRDGHWRKNWFLTYGFGKCSESQEHWPRVGQNGLEH